MTIITIDGPAGSGKSTVAKLLSRNLDFEYIDSGAIYRTMTFYGMQRYQGSCNGREEEIAENLKKRPDTIRITYENHIQLTWLFGENVGQAIRAPEVTRQVKYIADNASCRSFVNNMMWDIACRYSVVVDGRDIGTFVFPDASFKFYLDARIDVRAKRRAKELGVESRGDDFDNLLNEIAERDNQDRNRKIAPLKMAEDAMMIDTSDLTIEEVMEILLEKTNLQSKLNDQ